MENNETIKKLKMLFYNPKTGLINSKKLYEKAKENDIDVKYKDVDDFYKKQPVNQIMYRQTKPKKYNSIVAGYIRQYYQMDIMVYDRYTYNNYKYILCVIDVYSRYALARAMTNREMKTIIDNFESIMKEMGTCEKLQTDNEFNKKDFIDVLDKYDIKATFSSPYEINKNPIVERFNGTLANLLQKIRITTKRYDWNKYLQDAIENYNNTKHSTTKNTPSSIFYGKEFNLQKITYIENPFKINDKVRIIRKKQVFDKGDEIKFSKDVYLVEEIRGNKIKLNGIQKLYKPYELKSILELNEIPEEEEELQIEEPKKETKTIRINNYLRREGINTDNILTTKRNR